MSGATQRPAARVDGNERAVTRGLRLRIATSWQSFEAWVGTRSSAIALFAVALVVFAVQSAALPVGPGRDMARYVQAFVQLFHADPVLPAVVNTRGPLASLGVGVPLELGGVAAEAWLAVLFAASIVAWAAVAQVFGPRTAVLTSVLLLAYPGYGILFHGLSSDALFATGFAGWALVLCRAILRPSRLSFLAAGLGMGVLVLVRPGNQVLIGFTLLPLLLRARWGRRLAWMASFFIGSAGVTQGWRALADLRYGDSIVLAPSMAVLAVAAALSVLLLPPLWRRRVALIVVPCAVIGLVVAVAQGSSVRNPAEYVRLAAQGPSTGVFLFRAFEIDRIVSPDNGPASRRLGQVVERELLTEEPYRSYGVDVDTFFASGSDRVFQDLVRLPGVDLQAVTHEAIREHPWAFVTGIAGTTWELLWTRRVYANTASETVEPADATEPEPAAVAAGGGGLPPPGEGQPIPGSRFGQDIGTLYGAAREVWRSATEHPVVFDDPRDERRWERLGIETSRLAGRIPTRDARPELVHRLNQASRVFPPPVVWLVVGLVAVAWRRPRRAFVALAPAAAGLVVIVATALVAFPVAHYAAPVSPAFVLLAAAGLLGAHPRGRPRPRWR